MMKFLEHLGEASLRNVDSRQRLYYVIRERPLKKKHVAHISFKLGLQQKETAELIGVSVRTYQRQKSTTPITNAASENVLKLAELFQLGLNAFDNDEKALVSWLNSPIPALSNETPIRMLSSSLGIDLVKEELLRIEYGIY
jgi:putative toxin-antitoxin system antitoxin component (TIGR02293 family)